MIWTILITIAVLYNAYLTGEILKKLEERPTTFGEKKENGEEPSEPVGEILDPLEIKKLADKLEEK